MRLHNTIHGVIWDFVTENYLILLLQLLAVVSFTGCDSFDQNNAREPENASLRFVPITSGCNISAQELAALSGIEVDLPIVALHWDDHFLIVRQSTPTTVSVFDREGKFLQNIGRDGEGPGEFRIIRGLFPFADSLLIADVRNLRATVFSEDFEYKRSFPLPVQMSHSRLGLSSDGQLLVSGRMTDSRSFGSPIVELNWDGEVVQYFDEAIEKEGNLKGTVLPRALEASDDILISLPPIRYNLELWSEDGRISSMIHRDVEWFNWPPDLEDPHRVSEPENRLLDVQVDKGGYIWVLALIDGTDWREGIEDGRLVDHVAWVDAAIDIMNVESQESICTYRLPDRRVPVGFVGRQTILTYEEDRVGRPTVRFWRIEVTFPESVIG